MISTETKWSRNSTAQTRDVCGRDSKQLQIEEKSSHVADTDVLIPDKLNTVKENTVPPTHATAPEDWELSFSVTNTSKTFNI